MSGTCFLNIYDFTREPDLQKINWKDIYRYAGIKGEPDQKTKQMAEECANEALPVLTYKVSFLKSPLEWKDVEIDGQTYSQPVLPFEYGFSKDIGKNLSGCSEVLLFAATIGIGMDRLIAKYNRLSPSKALFMQAIGAERIEALCDCFNHHASDQAAKEGRFTRPRYSPGYGDLKIDVQKQLMVLLDCGRKLGISLSESLLMTPSKSVTAIMGICEKSENIKQNENSCVQNCALCTLEQCLYREDL